MGMKNLPRKSRFLVVAMWSKFRGHSKNCVFNIIIFSESVIVTFVSKLVTNNVLNLRNDGFFVLFRT